MSLWRVFRNLLLGRERTCPACGAIGRRDQDYIAFDAEVFTFDCGARIKFFDGVHNLNEPSEVLQACQYPTGWDS